MPLHKLGRYEDTLRKIKEACAKLWKEPHHYHYTEHGIKHSENIIENLAQLLRGQDLQLKPVECFILQAAAYLHDTGMQCVQPDLLKKVAGISRNEKIPFSYDALEKIRGKHAEISSCMIKNICNQAEERYTDLPDLGLGGIDCLVVDAIAKISMAHSDGNFRSYCELKDRRIPDCRDGAKMLLLAVLMRLGDALDADKIRCNWENYIQMEGRLPTVSRAHFWKHYWVSNTQH
ncbi:MAG: hypothetical protein HY920_07880 [Elusimicrobia bacterium]|nr:hypothetical protein [Elusimicrobiota bacterium]